jgi:hypothetical protein
MSACRHLSQLTRSAFVRTNAVDTLEKTSCHSLIAVLFCQMLTPCWKLIPLLSASLMPLPISVAQSNCAQPQLVKDVKFVPGQVWSYKTRPGEEDSTVTILRVESTPKLGVIVHVRIDGIHFSNCTGGPSPRRIEHAPFSRAALEASVGSKVGSLSKVPDYSAGYHDWLSHCGGVYKGTVDRVVATDDATFNAGLGCH